MKPSVPLLFALAACMAGMAVAHHSYAIFDAVKVETVEGTIATMEWTNPHVVIWVYVRDPSSPRSFAMYTFENGATNVLKRMGWHKNVFKAGDPISVAYAPLRDGRKGGHWIVATLADGRILRGAGAPASRDIPPPAAPRAPAKR